MRIVFSIVILVTVAVISSSCKRCYQCVVVDNDDDESLQWGYKEICERPKALEDYEAICNEAIVDAVELAKTTGETINYSCKCGENLDF